ncbi:cobyrinate a,c-diamide synthase [Butyrivibrio sp. INlla14]|uniref:cobyrinate a,c-diamide synthase n=1 Tax=Butyrivibrio sp. INlla14 TaxID=1520808 RepID=UPI0008767119|nr:cobyrinate a,c-diamide synthase [Butyrivibrio sp. INlla14]SCY02440.1 cobyrinic acid a,c-diamide synthase [Butyrivibrio sp. INlla14]
MAFDCKVQIPRVLICAPKSGSGKTLISCALMRILKRRGYNVAAFKCGPDYIDPMFHKKVLEVPSRNLDLFMAGEEGVKKTLRAGTLGEDIAIIEGVMGFFDGLSALSVEGSSHDLCKKTKTPALLVVDAKGMSRSVIPLIKGFMDYGQDKGKAVIRGVILNNISPMIVRDISGEIEKELDIPVLGFLPKLEGELFTSRHLGLVLPKEIPDILEKVDLVADKLEESLDLEKLLEIAKEAGVLSIDSNDKTEDRVHTRVGIALDEAFCFYYEDNLDLLKKMGAEIKFFSPIHDKEIPEVDRLILGGGYPELYGKKLMDNISMRESIKKAAMEGMPILAECGGFLYLQKSMTDIDGNSAMMAGVLEGESHMTSKLSHFGYVNVTALLDNPYLKMGETMKGHEFHYYDTTDNGCFLKMTKPLGKRSWEGYQCWKNVFGGFTHLYYPSNKEYVKRFLSL